MKFSLVYTPYFTNGEYPPLGASYIAAALRDTNHEIVVHDFQWSAYKDNLSYLDHLRKVENLGMASRDVSFILRPDLIVYSLYRKDYPEFKWMMPANYDEKAAWGAFALMLEELSKKWAEIVVADGTSAVLFSTYILNILSSF